MLVSVIESSGSLILLMRQGVLLKYEGQKPFWDSSDEIDVAMIADALVALYRFSSPDQATLLYERCLEPECSDAVKLCVIKACMTLKVEVSVSRHSSSHLFIIVVVVVIVICSRDQSPGSHHLNPCTSCRIGLGPSSKCELLTYAF